MFGSRSTTPVIYTVQLYVLLYLNIVINLIYLSILFNFATFLKTATCEWKWQKEFQLVAGKDKKKIAALICTYTHKDDCHVFTTWGIL